MDRQVVSLVLGRLGHRAHHAADRLLRGLRRHRDAARRRRADPARPGGDAGGGRRPARRDAPRRPGDPALPALARRAAAAATSAPPMPTTCRSPTLIGGAARQHAEARGGHRLFAVPVALFARHHHRHAAAARSTTGSSPRSSIGVISVPEFMVATLARAGLRRLAPMAARALLRATSHSPLGELLRVYAMPVDHAQPSSSRRR